MSDPAHAQRAAADPSVSAWVAANAGSGKTRVLTERVARLLLGGARPERIICLTYTKAAAAEMQNRLFGMLGSWAMLEDAPLRETLRALTGEDFEAMPVPPGAPPRTLADARRLFAMALETPGGLKIQTIHAFCDSLLRRFPLEAGAPPEFRVMDGRESAALIDRLLDEMAEEDAFLNLVAILNEGTLREVTSEVMGARVLFPPDVDDSAYCEAFGIPAPPDEQSALQRAMRRLDRTALDRMITAWKSGAKTDVAKSEKLSLAREAGDAVLADELIAAMLTTEGAPRAKHSTKGAIAVEPDAAVLCAALEASALEAREARQAVLAADRALRLARFGGALVARYKAAKEAAALLDFDDLVGKARDLLLRSDMAAWALYRLDGGVDHVLVDEAQDTSPAQWDVIRAITGEFTSGEGARPGGRTTFVVGDEKQSIYSFQGAAPWEFEAKRRQFGDDWRAVGADMREVGLEASFRSAPLILEAVDAVFAGERAVGLTASGLPARHRAFHKDRAGRIELWPHVVPPEKTPEPEPWAPVDFVSPMSPKAQLCRMVADRIAAMLDEGTPLPGKGRAVRPGDILILLRGRPGYLAPLISELKRRDVPVAGADRLKLGEDIAVQDLLSLMRVAVTKTDDLALAEVLRSPLCGVSDDELFALADGRKGALWSALWAARAGHERDALMIDDMMRRADFLRPYEFLERALVVHDGRRRIVTRLGREAEEAIDELLTQAMLFENTEVPSLSGFLAWMAAGSDEVKRDQEGARGEVRIMTCHGAKGLEAPVVILPDTMRAPRGSSGVVAATEIGGRPRAIWRMSQRQDCALTTAVRNREAVATAAEERRLLYVAMTRAEDWLIVGAAGKPERAGGTWRALIDEGFAALPMVRHEGTGIPEGALVLETTGRPREAEAAAPLAAPPVIDAPWLDRRVTVPQKLRRRAASSLAPHDGLPDLVDAETDQVPRPETGAPLLRDAALLKGEAIHLALETGLDSLAALRAVIDGAAPDLPEEQRATASAEALAARTLPEAAAFFAEDAIVEAGVSLLLPGRAERVIGRIDRLVVTDTVVRFVDFKSDAVPPAPGMAPTAYRLQLAAYRAALQAIYPERAVEAYLLWTATAQLEHLDAAALEAVWAEAW